jgi:nicotinamidase-related amidase
MPTVHAKPFPYFFDIDHVALLCIDMQRDFCQPGGFAESLGDNIKNTSMMKRAATLPAASSSTRQAQDTRRAASAAASLC